MGGGGRGQGYSNRKISTMKKISPAEEVGHIDGRDNRFDLCQANPRTGRSNDKKSCAIVSTERVLGQFKFGRKS